MKLFTSKKGFEMSINFLATLILAMVVFGYGLTFAYKSFAGAGDLSEKTLGELESRMGDILCADDQLVCVGQSSKELNRGELGVFGVKISNFFQADSTDFRINHISTRYPNANGDMVDGDEHIDILFNEADFVVPLNGQVEQAIGVQPNSLAIKGVKYVLTFEVQRHSLAGSYVPYTDDSVKKLYVTVK